MFPTPIQDSQLSLTTSQGQGYDIKKFIRIFRGRYTYQLIGCCHSEEQNALGPGSKNQRSRGFGLPRLKVDPLKLGATEILCIVAMGNPVNDRFRRRPSTSVLRQFLYIGRGWSGLGSLGPMPPFCVMDEPRRLSLIFKEHYVLHRGLHLTPLHFKRHCCISSVSVVSRMSSPLVSPPSVVFPVESSFSLMFAPLTFHP